MDHQWDAADSARRTFFIGLSSITALALASCAGSAGKVESSKSKGEGGEAEVTPGEDLMQEHAVLERILCVYDEAALRAESGKPFDPALIATTAEIVRRFVEDYHEKLEETFVFPRLEKASKELELVATLKDQHVKGRQLTDAILAAAKPAGSVDASKLAGLLRSFTRMYRPHASREGSVLFPAFRKTLDRDGYHELGEKFEDREHELFGEHGFEATVDQVSKIEAALGIQDLASFTPR